MKTAPGKYLIEIDHTSITEFTKNIWDSIVNETYDHLGEKYSDETHPELKLHHLVFRLNEKTLEVARGKFPFLSGTVMFLDYEPGALNVPHVDGVSTDTKLFDYNFVVPIQNSESVVTVYFEDMELEDFPDYRSRYPKNFKKLTRRDFTPVFTYILTKPTLLYHQQLHGAENIGTKRRIAAAWKMNKNQSIDDITDWCKSQNFEVKSVY